MQESTPRISNPAAKIYPTDHDLSLLIARRRAELLGIELPLTTREAANYIGFHLKTIERMARSGEIPAHPVSGVRHRTWKFYPSELDLWLRARAATPRCP